MKFFCPYSSWGRFCLILCPNRFTADYWISSFFATTACLNMSCILTQFCFKKTLQAECNKVFSLKLCFICPPFCMLIGQSTDISAIFEIYPPISKYISQYQNTTANPWIYPPTELSDQFLLNTKKPAHRMQQTAFTFPQS